MADAQKLARIFRALSVDTRIRIVQLLKNRALCVGALSARLDVTQGAVSQHLRVLRDANLVVPEKRGYYVHYRLNEKTLLRWKNAVERFLEDKQRPGQLATSEICKGKNQKPYGETKGFQKLKKPLGNSAAHLSVSKRATAIKRSTHAQNSPGGVRRAK